MTTENFIDIIKRHCKVELVDKDSKLVEDLGLCSFDMMMVIVEAEKEHGSQYSFQITKKIKTVSDFYYQFK